MAEFKPQSVPDPLPEPGGRRSKGIYNSGPTFEEPQGRFKQFYSNNKWYVWAIVVGVIIIGVLSYFAFHKRAAEPTKDANVVMTIDAADTASVDGEIIYKVQIENHDPSKLVDMGLETIYDSGLNYISSVPNSSDGGGSNFPVPDLSNGENAVVMIKVKATGDLNEDKHFTARLHYKFNNFNSEFTAEASHTTRLVAADIVLDVTGPEKINNSAAANYDVYYRNDSNKTIKDARIQVTFPSEFHLDNSNPQATVGNNIWNVKDLKQNDSGKISFSGNFSSAHSGQSAIFKIEFLALADNNAYFTQASTTYMTTIESLPLAVEQSLSNEAKDGVVDPGNAIQYEVKFQNNTQVAATGVNVVVEVDSKAVDSNSIKAETGLVQGNTITWNASSVSQLEKLQPGQYGTVRFALQVKNPAVSDNSENITVVTKSKIRSDQNAFLDGNVLTLKISSPSSIEKGLTSVSGSIPPKVGQTTVLQESISLKNGSNDYRDGLLIGFIPLGATLDKSSISSSETANVKYDATTGKLTWNVGQLSAHSGSTSPLRTLKFNVSITPSSNQVGQQMSLFKNITFTAKDTFTGQNISLNTQELSTDYLAGDGNGRVVE